MVENGIWVNTLDPNVLLTSFASPSMSVVLSGIDAREAQSLQAVHAGRCVTVG
jgi:hypothetical protein